MGLLDRADNELIKKHNINEQFLIQMCNSNKMKPYMYTTKGQKLLEVVQKVVTIVYILISLLNPLIKNISNRNNNTVFDYSTYTNLEIKTEFVQQGNNQTIMRFWFKFYF
jgi:hypothetical protein